MSWIIIYVGNRGALELDTKAKRDLDLATCTPRAPYAHPFRTQWPFRMFTSDKQISPPSLVLKLKSCQVLHKWIPKAEKLKRIFTPKECKCEEFFLRRRLGGEMCSSDVIMHKGHFLLSSLWVSYTRQDVMMGETADWDVLAHTEWRWTMMFSRSTNKNPRLTLDNAVYIIDTWKAPKKCSLFECRCI